MPVLIFASRPRHLAWGGVINFMPAYTNPGNINLAASQARVPAFLCPSDASTNSGWDGQCNYAANQGGWLCDRSDQPALPTDISPSEVQTGVLYYLSQVRFSDITDGTSNTMMFSEKLRGTGNPDPRRDLFAIPNQNTMPAFYQACIGINPLTTTPLTSKWGWSWVMGENCCTLYNHVSVPNTFSCAGQGFTGGMTNMAMQVSANSNHPGGVVSLLCDSSVRFYSNTVDLATWRAIGTRSGGEVNTDVP